MPHRSFLLIVIFLLLNALGLCAETRTFGKGEAISFEMPPARLSALPSFHVPSVGSLDEPWQFRQILYDADTTRSNYEDYLNAVPVGLEFTHLGRGYLATLHTIFHTTDGGLSWRNLDPAPPPNTITTPYTSLRSPVYLSGISARPVERTAATLDTLLLSAYNAEEMSGHVRVMYHAQNPQLWSESQLEVDYWLHGVAVRDSNNVFAMAGLDGQLYQNDSLWYPNSWEVLNPTKVLIQTGRDDSLFFVETWVGTIIRRQNLLAAVGSHQWISRDGGRWWRITPSADTLFDNAVSFADSLHGVVGGGMISPQSRGWAHFTTDGGRTWSGRTLNTTMPVRAVHMVTPLIGFAGGGNYRFGSGEIWRTTNGGAAWQRDMQVTAEITAISSTRISSAYVDVTAAGFFPDFRGGIWHTRLYLPDTTGALLMADPDSLDFGNVLPGAYDTLTVVLRNSGTIADTITGITVQGGSNPFYALWPSGARGIAPDEEMDLPILFHSNTAGEFSRTVLVNNLYSGRVTIECRANCGTNAAEPTASLLPTAPTLTVWPNPANAVFQIRYNVPVTGEVALRIYDLNGRMVETLTQGMRAAGQYTLTWDASAAASGIYFIRLNAHGYAPQTQKILLLK